MKFYYPLQIDRYTKDNEDPGSHHSGQNWSLDFPAPEGTELYAITDGTVVVCRSDNTYDAHEEGNTGKCVSIKFNLNGVGTLYATYMHMSKVNVTLNQSVKMGDVIGLVGDTGYSFGAHCHIQISTSEWGKDPIYVKAVDGEKYRFEHPDSMPLVEKLFRYLSVNYSSGRVGGSRFSNWYWSGDSRTVGLINTTGTEGQGYGGEGLSKLRSEASNIASSVRGNGGHNLALWWGVNGLEDGYVEVYKQIADSVGSNGAVYVCTVGKVFDTHGGDGSSTLGQEGGGGSVTVEEYNLRINQFNNKLKNALSNISNIKILDVWQFIEDETAGKPATDYCEVGNGLHYKGSLYQKIYDWCKEQVPAYKDWEDVATNGKDDIPIIYDGLRELGFSRAAAIGALANMSHESNWITHMIGYNSSYFVSYVSRSREDLLDYMNSATSANDLYNKVQSTSTNGDLTGYGLTQFTAIDNITALYIYHTETGLPYDRLGVQLRAFKKVLEDKGMWQRINNYSDCGDAASDLCINYEVPVDRYNEAVRRAGEAKRLESEHDYFYD